MAKYKINTAAQTAVKKKKQQTNSTTVQQAGTGLKGNSGALAIALQKKQKAAGIPTVTFQKPKTEQTTWFSSALETLQKMKEERENNFDARFTPEYFDNNSRAKALLSSSPDTSSAAEIAEQMDIFRQVQAGMNYRARKGEEAEYAPGSKLYELNDNINKNIAATWQEAFRGKATEVDVKYALERWKKSAAEADPASDYYRRTMADIADMEEWASNSFSSFASKNVAEAAAKIAQNNVELRKMGNSQQDYNTISRAVSHFTNSDPVMVVRNDGELRRILGFDALESEYGNDYAALSDAVLEKAYGILDGTADMVTDIGRAQLELENAELTEQMYAAAEKRDYLLDTENYRRQVESAFAKGAYNDYQVDEYEPITPYTWTDPSTGASETRYNYNAPTLEQMIADPEDVRAKYDRVSAHPSLTGYAQEIDLASYMSDEERRKYQAYVQEYGSEAAESQYYERLLRDELVRRQTEAINAQNAAFTEEHPVLGNIASFAYNQLGNVGEIANAGRMALGMEPSLEAEQFSQAKDTVRSTTYNMVEEAAPWANVNIGGKNYNLLNLPLQAAHAVGDELLSKAAFGPLSTLWMGVSSGASEAVDAYNETGNRLTALLTGAISGVAEYKSEGWGDKLLGDADMMTDSIMKYILANGAGEAVEELASMGISEAGDIASHLLTGEKSERQQRLKYLMDNGYSTGGAWVKMLEEFGTEAAQTAVVSFLSGGAMSGGNAAINAPARNAHFANVGNMVAAQNNIIPLLQEGLQSKNRNTKRLSERLYDKLVKNDGQLPNDAETNAEVQVLSENQKAEQQAADTARQQENQQAKTEAAMRDPGQKSVRDVQQEKQDTAKQQENNQQRTEQLMRAPSKRETRQIGKVYEKVMRALDVEIKGNAKQMAKALDKRLKDLGQGQIPQVSEAIAAVVKGEPTQDQLDIVEATAMKDGILKDLVDAYGGLKQRREAATKLPVETVDNMPQGEKRAEQAMPKAVYAPETAEVILTSEDGEEVSAEIEGFSTDEHGKVAAIVQGKITPISELQIRDEGSSMLIHRAAELGDADAAAVMLDNYSAAEQDVSSYANAFEAAFDYGSVGRSSAAARQSALVSNLSDAQFKAAYNAGIAARASRPAVSASTSGGKVSFAGDLGSRLDGLDGNQKSAINALRRLAETGTVNIEFFESEADDQGRYTAENGSYDPRTNTIRIDINAGRNRKTDVANFALLRVASHELTHYLRAQNTEGYDSLMNFVADNLNKFMGSSFEESITVKMDRQPELDYDGAVEEVVADACEMMLRDSTALQQLAQENRGLFKRIQDWLHEFVDNVRRAFKGVNASSFEARLLEKAEGMQKLWDNALVKAMENVQQVQESPSAESDADAKFSKRNNVEFAEDKYYGRVIDKIRTANPNGYTKVGRILSGSVLNRIGFPEADLYFDNSKILKQLEGHEDHIDEEALKWIPDILRDPTVVAEANAKNTANIFAEKMVGNSPVMVAVMMAHDRSGRNIINKVRTIHARRDFMSKISDETVLYLNPDKKRTRDWFQARGNDVPLGGTKYGFIRSIAQPDDSVKLSLRNQDRTVRDLLLTAADRYAKNKPQQELLERYRAKAEELANKREELDKVRADIRKREKAYLRNPDSVTTEGLTELNQQKNRANIYAVQADRLNDEIEKILASEPLRKVMQNIVSDVNNADRKTRNQILAQAREKREASELRRKIRGIADDWDRRLKSPTQSKYIPRSMVGAVIAARELVDTRSGREGEKALAKLAQIRSVYEGYKNDSTFAYVYDPVVAEMLESLTKKAGDKNIYQLDKADLKSIYDTMKALRKQVSEAAKLKAGTYAASIIDAGKQMYQETSEAAPMMKGALGRYLNWQLTPDKFFARLAGFKKNSIWSKVAKSFSDGTEKMLEIQRQAYYHFRKWTESKEFDKLNSTRDKDMIDIGLKDANGKPVKITRGMMLEVYMHLSSEDNRMAMMYGGFSVPNMKKYYAGKIKEAYGTGSVNTFGMSAEIFQLMEQLNNPDLTEDQRTEIQRQIDNAEAVGLERMEAMRKRIEGKLTGWDLEIIDAVHDWNDNISRDYINDVTLDMYDIKKAAVPNYYRINRDTAFVNTDFESIQRNMNLENWGSLKERVKSRAPILLGDIAFTMDSGIKQMSQYVGYVRAQRDFNKLYNLRMPGMTGSVQKIVETKFGSGKHSFGASGAQYLENYIGSITGSRQSESDFLSVIRRNLPRATMSLNFRVGFSQLSALPKAAVEVGWDNALKGFATGGLKSMFTKKAREDLARKNVWFWQRYQGEGGQREFADIKGGTDPISKAWNWVDNFTRGWLLNLNQKMDVTATVAMYDMARSWAKKQGYVEGTEKFEQQVNQKYSDILRNTQAANTVTERSDLARGSGTGNSILTMYKSEAFANFNIMYDSVARWRKYIQDYKAGRNGVTKSDVTKAGLHFVNSVTTVVVASSALNALIKLLFNAMLSNMNGYRDDEGEVSKDGIAEAIAKEVANDAAGMFTLGGQLYDFLAAVIFKEQYYAPSYAALDDFTKIAESIVNLVNKEDKGKDDYLKVGEKLILSACNMFGIPANNAKRQVNGLIDTINDIGNGEFMKWEASADRSTTTNIRRLAQAELAGDKAKWDAVYEELSANYLAEQNEELTEKEFISRFKEYIGDQYKDGAMTKEDATKLLKARTDVQEEHDLFWQFDKWDYAIENGSSEGYAIFNRLKNAVASNKSGEIKNTMNFYMQHGYSEKDMRSEVKSKAMELYCDDAMTWNQALTILLEHCNNSSNNYDDEHAQYWLKREWDYAKAHDGSSGDYAKYGDFYDAIENNKNADKFVEELFTHSESEKKARTAAMNSISSRYKYAYIDALIAGDTKKANQILEWALRAYEAIGLNRNKELRYIQKNWVPEEEDD